MKINGWDISGAQARQWNVTPGFSNIENESEWQRGVRCHFSRQDPSDLRPCRLLSWYMDLVEIRFCRTAAPYFLR